MLTYRGKPVQRLVAGENVDTLLLELVSTRQFGQMAQVILIAKGGRDAWHVDGNDEPLTERFAKRMGVKKMMQNFYSESNPNPCTKWAWCARVRPLTSGSPQWCA